MSRSIHKCSECSPESKWCHECRTHKPLAFFGNNRTAQDGKSKRCRLCINAYYNKNKERLNLLQKSSRYGVSADDLVALFSSQDGLCAICSTPILLYSEGKGSGKSACLDHCHTTGKVRAFLCTQCNVVVGQSRESIEMLELTIEYLRKHAD